MKKQPLAIVILAAGSGTRMKSALPKVIHELAGRPMIGHVLETARSLSPEKIVVVTGPGMDDVKKAVAPHPVALQKKPLGTADAVKAALPALKNFKGDILVLYGDGPLYRTETLQGLLDAMHKKKAATGWLAMRLDDPAGYGRMICGKNGALQNIVEEKDATAAQKRIDLCWTGVMCAQAAKLSAWIEKVGNKNAKGEYYLTALPAIAAKAGGVSTVALSPEEEALGANDRTELATLERKMQDRLRARAMENGATLIDPATVYFSWDTKLGRDVIVEPNVFFGPGVSVADGARIRAFSHIEGAKIGAGTSIGPFARLRPGAVIGKGSKIGNFVEVKNATLGAGVKAAHLAYIGDAEIGDGVNFSCGAITVNYDGTCKHKTVVGDGAMIGSNVNLIAPVSVGAGAYVAAGTSVTKNVPPDALAVGREKPTIREGWAKARREKEAGTESARPRKQAGAKLSL